MELSDKKYQISDWVSNPM